MIKLYQFPISHFCEKVRWALAYKKLSYKMCNLLPGPHAKKAMSLAKTSEVPILQHDKNVIQCSSNIIDYLDATFPNNKLTPINEMQQLECAEWEKFADKEIGQSVQIFFYHTLLKHPDILIPIFAYQGPWYGKWLMKIVFPTLTKKMRGIMRINEKSAERAKLKLKNAIDKINNRLLDHSYLVGNSFSRADLAVASLLAPLVQADKYGMPWPSPLPEPLQATVDGWQADLLWVKKMYAEYR
ncbi:hypothetical protein MNBD_GAMMA08-2297 [hydrothermal vent metagenome]|uniref:Glutathione S-transferase n=1 Tax=hydrothermal vent metagenome TaxID=652676 RepID=A0A3B0WSU5_9ZZZZ